MSAMKQKRYTRERILTEHLDCICKFI